MASGQEAAKDMAQVSETEKAKLEEVMKDVKNNLSKTIDMSSNDDQITGMAVTHVRSTFHHKTIRLRTFSWIGNFTTRVPEFIVGGDGATMVHKGSKGAVVYGTLPENPISAAWLLAWSKPDDPTKPIRVYVRSGTREKMPPQNINDWNEIEKELDQSGEISFHLDPESGANLTGRIQNDADNIAYVVTSLNHNE